MSSTAPTFPLVGVITPVVVGVVLWAMFGSPFALVGAVLGPAMVLAHFGDGVRRARREDRHRRNRERLDREVSERQAHARVDAERTSAAREHPSVEQIAAMAEWVPRGDATTVLRAGSTTRDGHGGFPWLVDVDGGVAVVGDGSAARAVWDSLFVHGCASLGRPTAGSDRVDWPGGAWISRRDIAIAGTTIRCCGSRVLSVTERGRLPHTGEWVPDDTSRFTEAMARVSVDDGPLDWCDRVRCARGVGLAGAEPFVMELTSESPHILIVGRTGAGKSEFLASLIADLSERHSPRELSWVGIDCKGGATLLPLASLTNCRGVVTDLDDLLLERALAALRNEVVSRESTLRAEGVSRIEDSGTLGRLVILVDEFPELLRIHPTAVELLADIARRGRSLGLHLVLATQHGSSLHRDGLAANISTRIVFPLGNAHDESSLLGGPPPSRPAVGNPVVALPDGRRLSLRVRTGARIPDIYSVAGERASPLWREALQPPIHGLEGFGLFDDVTADSPPVARWNPRDGDIVVVGRRGSGRTTAIHALLAGRNAVAARRREDIEVDADIIVLDDVDRLADGLSVADQHDLIARLASRRLEPTPPTLVFSATSWLPRLHGLVPNVLVLGTGVRDIHLATGEPAETFDPSAKPGVGSWRGRRVVIYARTDSIETESIP